MQAKFVFIIGAQCTGKTTLSKILAEHVRNDHNALRCHLLSETARTILKSHGFTREDVREGGSRCLELQKLIMDSQSSAEMQARTEKFDVIISDRSGIDALVYTLMYCGVDATEQLLHSSVWKDLKDSLQNGRVIVCEPVREWLFDDGTRLVPASWEEWGQTHILFCDLLQKNHINYVVLPASIRSLRDRVAFVCSLCE